ncbi:amidase [Actinoplanes sp. CA-131856]
MAASLFVVGLSAVPASAYSSVPVALGDQWNVNDAAIPGLDTGSVRSTSANALLGYGGIRVKVPGGTSMLNGALLRGFGLTQRSPGSYAGKHSVVVDGVAVTRELTVDAADSFGRFFDTFTNTTRRPLRIDVAFGGQLGYNTGTNQSTVASTSSGDTRITGRDGWVSFFTPSAGAGSASTNGPSATVLGAPGTLARVGNFLRDPFRNPLPATGDEANHPGFVNQLTLYPGRSLSLAHFVVTGLSETRNAPGASAPPTAGSQVAAVQAAAAALTTKPDFTGLSAAEVCSLANFPSSGKSCARYGGKVPGAVISPVTQPVVKTSSPYNVVGKTVVQMRADMSSGRTNAQQIVQAYLDRIAAYDQGPLGLHSVLYLAPDALAQAKAADQARKRGDKRPLLGIPILVKDIIDTKDMPTTGGSLVFDGYRPFKDAWQVAKLREAGAIILGKANLSEFANSGYFSESAYGQVWNAFDPSRSSIGSSGGSAVAVASGFAAAALGSQTGDSLWGPSGAANLVSLRGTDGMQSGDGTMPLTVVQDYVGVIAQSVEDQALLLNTVAVGNPSDSLDDVADGHRPKDWTKYLNGKALKGVVIGVPADAFTDPFGTTEVSSALRAKFAAFRKAGATIKEISATPAAPARTYTGDTGYEGWRQWIAAHPDNPYKTAEEVITSAKKLPYNVRTTYTGTGAMTPEQLAAMQAWRASYRAMLGTWMDDEGVDVVLYPTELSDIHLNDSSGNSFGRRDPQSSGAGVPTAIFPAGLNAHGQPVGFQLQGKQFQDPELLGYAYAFEKIAGGRALPRITPALRYGFRR